MLITPFVSLLLLLNNISIAQIQKNPGVYVEEVSSKPLSVAQVETAIPAFIGYTEIASRDLLFVPVKVSSFRIRKNIWSWRNNRKICFIPFPETIFCQRRLALLYCKCWSL